MLRQVQGLVLTVVEVEKKMVQLKRMTKGDLIMDADKRGLPSTWKMLLCKRLLEATGPDALRLHDQDDWPGSLTLEQLQSELLHHNIGLPERDCSLKRGELTKAELQAILMEYDARNAASTAEEVPTTEQATKRLRSE